MGSLATDANDGEKEIHVLVTGFGVRSSISAHLVLGYLVLQIPANLIHSRLGKTGSILPTSLPAVFPAYINGPTCLQ